MQHHKYHVGAIAVLTGALVCAASGISPANATSVRDAINARYSVYSQALKARDVPTVVGMETPDFTHVLANGKLQNRQQSDTEFMQQMKTTQSISSCATKIQSISVKGNQTTAVVWQSIEATLLDSKGGKHSVVSNTSSRDTWVKSTKGWYLRKSVDITSHNVVDGRLVK